MTLEKLDIIDDRHVGKLIIATSFKGQDLSGTFFVGATLINCNFDGADLTNARFDGATVIGCQFLDAIFDGMSVTAAIFIGDAPDPEGVRGITVIGCPIRKLARNWVRKASTERLKEIRSKLIEGTLDRDTVNEMTSSEWRILDDGSSQALFAAIRLGDTPETNRFAAEIMAWIAAELSKRDMEGTNQ